MAITVTKSKPLALKKPEAAAEDTAASAPPSFVATAAPEPSYTWPGVLAIIAVVMVLVLLALQWMEWSYYDAPPAIFLKPIVPAAV